MSPIYINGKLLLHGVSTPYTPPVKRPGLLKRLLRRV